ncbi:MAG: rhodanese-like domain-containing protein [Bdellovibrionaceae bacterium]|nr:rhodanese-like domain-containing protein [Pseudobdellovibrionaceae bacterium]
MIKLLIPTVIVLVIAYKYYQTRKVKSLLPSLMSRGATIIDVRTPEEFRSGSHPSSINIPLQEIENQIKKIDPTKPVVLCCASGMRSQQAMSILKKNGFANVVNAGPWTNTL